MHLLKTYGLQLILLSIFIFIIMIVPVTVRANFSLTTNLVVSNAPTDLISDTIRFLPRTFESIDYQYYINQIISSSLPNIEDHILNLSAFGSRVTGYGGYEQTINYILNFFTNQGLVNVQTISYPLLIPMDYDTKINLNGVNYTAHAFIPNSVHTNKISYSGLSGTLVYGGSGEYIDLDGKEIENKIVVLEFNTQDNWLNTVSLGAKAVVFLSTNDTNRFEAQSKSVEIPLEFPRIYIENETLATIIKDSSMQFNQSITLYSDVEWKEIDAKNIMGFLPGLDDDLIIISAYFDSSSCIPAISPGADEACGIATLLELIRIIKENNIIPQKSLMFLALSGHNQAAAGAREFVFQNYKNLNQNGGIKLFLSLDLS
ncbi:M28 family peptidase, partial [Candidatus Hodarchaeum mangrovi]